MASVVRKSMAARASGVLPLSTAENRVQLEHRRKQSGRLLAKTAAPSSS